MKFERDQRLNETTFNELDKLTKQAFPSTIRANRTGGCSVSNLTFGRVGSDLLARGQVACGSGTEHTPSILLQGIADATTNDAPTVELSNTDMLQFAPFTRGSTNVHVRCTCLDYRFRFAEYNDRVNVHLAPAPEPYTPSGTHPPANPAETPGVCKHLYALVEVLTNMGVLEG